MKNPGLRKPRPAMNQDESIGLEYLSRGGSPGEVLYTVCQEIQFILEGARFSLQPAHLLYLRFHRWDFSENP
jgi:hypothetical protein